MVPLLRPSAFKDIDRKPWQQQTWRQDCPVFSGSVTEGMVTHAWALWLPAEQVDVNQILKLAQPCFS